MFLSVNAALSLLSDNVEPIYHFYVLYFYAAVPRYYLCHKQTTTTTKKKQEKHKTEKNTMVWASCGSYWTKRAETELLFLLF